MSVFSKQNVPETKVNRNTFDLSKQVNMTLDMGKLYPTLCQEVLPGDTFKIDAAFGLRFMPLVFPIQTKVRADMHFFYVRNRNLWDGFQDFITSNSNKDTMPYLGNVNMKDIAKTGELGDYMGLPTTIVGTKKDNGILNTKQFYIHRGVSLNNDDCLLVNDQSYNSRLFKFEEIQEQGVIRTEYLSAPITNTGFNYTDNLTIELFCGVEGFLEKLSKDFIAAIHYAPKDVYGDRFSPYYVGEFGAVKTVADCEYTQHITFKLREGKFGTAGRLLNLYLIPKNIKYKFDEITSSYDAIPISTWCQDNNFYPEMLTTVGEFNIYSIYANSTDVVEWTTQLSQYPTKINALPFRAYESIYNSFYRDERNNPYELDGEVQTNRYLPTTAGGEDNTLYQLRRRNWEQDFLTTALTSPQLGSAPLVGITSSGVATLQSEDGTMYQVKLKTAEDADTVIGAEYTTNLPNDVSRSIVNMASSGISINDFRAVNSLQRWLETNYRKGLKYKDQIASHFGVDISYSTLDMPEFIGGFSQFVDVNQVNQTSEGTELSPLGSFAGQASCVAGSQHSVNHYCDEHGYIIGILSVVPVPSYSQLLPKHFTKFETLDYYFPEFGHIGYQPITYREVCPLQAAQLDTNVNSTFGYQRAWYDYLANTDEVHGEFRTSLRDFVLGRIYNTLPSISESFLLVDSKQMNNPFAVNEGDHILGQIHFKILAKRPIPRYGIPKIE